MSRPESVDVNASASSVPPESSASSMSSASPIPLSESHAALPSRGPLAAQLLSGAASGTLELPVCLDCGTVQYPVRELCRHCLSPSLQLSAVSNTGTLLACTRLHRTNHPHFRSMLPLRVGSVGLDVGPTVLALIPEASSMGQRVTVSPSLDGSGQAVLSALPTLQAQQAQKPLEDV